jgi:hypothetical protein
VEFTVENGRDLRDELKSGQAMLVHPKDVSVVRVEDTGELIGYLVRLPDLSRVD